MIELRKRVLSSGFVVLEYRDDYPRFKMTTEGVVQVDGEWRRVPYVDENGDPIDNPRDLENKG